jgi:hypothetical protein
MIITQMISTNKKANSVKSSWKMVSVHIKRNANLLMDHINSEKTHKSTQNTKLNNVGYLFIKEHVCMETDAILSIKNSLKYAQNNLLT